VEQQKGAWRLVRGAWKNKRRLWAVGLGLWARTKRKTKMVRGKAKNGAKRIMDMGFA
jgi:hypothetical protein